MPTELWNQALVDQIDFHWRTALRPRLTGLSTPEYHWEPAPGWGVRPDGSGPDLHGTGGWRIDFAYPTPEPAPLTTVAWRLGHVIVGVLAVRTAAHFGGPPTDYDSWPYAGTAEEALAQLDEQYAAWLTGVRGLGEDGLRRPCGPAEGGYAAEPLAVLVLHNHRELIHHLAEVCLLRDLYLRLGTA